MRQPWSPARAFEPEVVVAHLGPTNSGKSHAALAALAAAGAGVYAAPLRLLAREGYEKLRVGARAGLRTGEERVDPGAPILCCTAELTPLTGEVLVLDEVHWADDPERGWAWGRLLASAAYRQIHLVGAANAEPLLRAAYGERLEVRRTPRLVPLTWGGSVGVGEAPPGSLVVAFSRKAVLSLARQIGEASGQRVGALYGALPPQTRRAEIERFVAGELDVLCVTDVIGHGINLPARTVVMAETSKWDGRRRRPLHLWEAAQIVGRAGRFGLAEAGDARVLRGVPGLEANAALVRRAVEAAEGSRAAAPNLTSAPIRPTLDDLAASNGRELRAAVIAWHAQAEAAALDERRWLRPAPLAGLAAALDALGHAGLLDSLGVEELWRLGTLPVEDPAWLVELGRALVDPSRRLRAAERREERAWSIEEAERTAARARGLASLAGAFPGVGGLDRDELLAVEAAAASRISELLEGEIAGNRFGVCGACRRPCPPWAA
ncbi:MAG: helicase-related protein, partial [Acidimicrobiales bacterium]